MASFRCFVSAVMANNVSAGRPEGRVLYISRSLYKKEIGSGAGPTNRKGPNRPACLRVCTSARLHVCTSNTSACLHVYASTHPHVHTSTALLRYSPQHIQPQRQAQAATDRHNQRAIESHMQPQCAVRKCKQPHSEFDPIWHAVAQGDTNCHFTTVRGMC